jgi:hypothetical protein
MTKNKFIYGLQQLKKNQVSAAKTDGLKVTVSLHKVEPNSAFLCKSVLKRTYKVIGHRKNLTLFSNSNF